MANSRPGVYVNERLLPAPITVQGTADAAGAVVGEFAKGPESVTRVTSWYEFTEKFGEYNAAYPATFGVGQFFTNGGSELYVRRVLAADAVAANAAIAEAAGGADVGTITAKNRGANGNNIRFEFSPSNQSGLFDLSVFLEGGASSADSDETNDQLAESYINLDLSDSGSADYIVTVVNQASTLIEVEITNGGSPATTRTPLVTGSNGTAPSASDYSNTLSDFTAVDRPFVVFAPMLNSKLSLADAKTVQGALVSWAKSNNSFAVLETASGLTVNEALTDASSYEATSYAGVYYPHLYMPDPLGRSSSALRLVGPAGGVAGMILYTDKQQGPYKAPAGIRANVRGAVALEKAFTTAELDSMNTATSPVNPIRNLPGSGIVVMGARTLLQDGTANKYINMRRSLIYIRKRLSDLAQFAIFRNNDERLWRELRTTFTIFLNNYWSQGGLRGATSEQAFFVKVDQQNNPNSAIQNGEVNIQVGVALQYPAEFITIDLSQQTAA